LPQQSIGASWIDLPDLEIDPCLRAFGTIALGRGGRIGAEVFLTLNRDAASFVEQPGEQWILNDKNPATDGAMNNQISQQ